MTNKMAVGARFVVHVVLYKVKKFKPMKSCTLQKAVWQMNKSPPRLSCLPQRRSARRETRRGARGKGPVTDRKRFFTILVLLTLGAGRQAHCPTSNGQKRRPPHRRHLLVDDDEEAFATLLLAATSAALQTRASREAK
jgi:hypothetical protein